MTPDEMGLADAADIEVPPAPAGWEPDEDQAPDMAVRDNNVEANE